MKDQLSISNIFSDDPWCYKVLHAFSSEIPSFASDMKQIMGLLSSDSRHQPKAKAAIWHAELQVPTTYSRDSPFFSEWIKNELTCASNDLVAW